MGAQSMRARLAAAEAAGAALRAGARALPGLTGAGLVSYGAWMIYAPAGYLTAGALVLADVVYGRAGS